MPVRPYRAASKQTLVWLVICLLGAFGPIGPMVAYGTKDTSPWLFGLAILIFIISLVIATFVTGALKRGRFRRIADYLRPKGIELVLKPSEEQREAFLAPLERLKDWMDLRMGPKGIEWYAEVSHPQGAMRLFEYEYTAGRQIHMITIVGWPASRTDLPVAALGSLDGFKAWRMTRWMRSILWRKYDLKDEGFGEMGKRWQLTGSAASGLRFLSPAVRELLESSPLGETWYIGGGWVCCYYGQPLDPENMAKFIDRAETVLRSPI